MRAAILARVSGKDQAEEDRHSLPVQMEIMTRFAASKGWQVVRVFEIPGESAYTEVLARRPEFAAALVAAERGEFEVLIIDEMTRFAREQYLAHDSMRRLRHCGVQLWAASMDLELTSNPMLAGIFAAVAQESSRLQGAKITASKARRFRMGLHNGDVPFGYRAVGPGQPLEIVPEEAAAVQWAFERYRITASVTDVARGLNERGLRPHSKQGKRIFEVSSAQSLLETVYYTGKVVHRGKVGPGLHEAIISSELFDEVQERRRRKAARGQRAPRSRRLCSGVIVCASCRASLTVSAGGNGTGYYRHAQALQPACTNRGPAFRMEEVHAQIDEVFGGIDYRDAAWLAYVNQREVLPAPNTELEVEAGELEAERKRLIAVFTKGHMSEHEYDSAMAELVARRARLPLPFNRVRETLLKVASFADVWSRANESAKREALRIMVEYVAADSAGQTIALAPREEYEPLMALRADYVASVRLSTPGRNRTCVAAQGRRLFWPEELVGAA